MQCIAWFRTLVLVCALTAALALPALATGPAGSGATATCTGDCGPEMDPTGVPASEADSDCGPAMDPTG